MEISFYKVFKKACLEKKYVRKKVEVLTCDISFGLILENGEMICLFAYKDNPKIYYVGSTQQITPEERSELLNMFDKSGTDETRKEQALEFLLTEFGNEVLL